MPFPTARVHSYTRCDMVSNDVLTFGRRWFVPLACVLLLLGGFALDLATPQALVVAILYNVAIALAPLAEQRWMPWPMLGLAFVANVVSGYVNARAIPLDTIAVLNRVMVGVSFLLVGLLSVALRRSTSRATALQLEEERADREASLRFMLSHLGEPLHSNELLESAAPELARLLASPALAIVTVRDNRFAPPRYAAPTSPSEVQLGEAASWPVLAVLQGDSVVCSARTYTGPVTVGRWRRSNGSDLVVYAERPGVPHAPMLLEEALRSLEPLLDRAQLLEKLEERGETLERRNGVIRDLIYAFSHDLRTPLMANAMNMQQALDGAFGALTEEYRRTLRNGLDANRDLLELAEELLLVAQYESGEAAAVEETVDLAQLVRDVAARCESVFDARGVTLDIATPRSLTALVRGNDMRRAVQNLLDNAAKYAPAGSEVRVSLVPENDSTSAQGVRLVVEDRGPGVPEPQRARLFQRFSSGRAGGGLGLGLYLVKQVVGAHGGRVHYEPRAGGGSRFSVWLPLAREVVTA